MVNIVILDDEIFSISGSDKDEVYDLWESDLDDISDDFNLFIFDIAEDAFKKIQELGNNTIVILDMKMPKIDGASFLKMIRENECTIPVIAYTSDDSTDKIMDLLKNDIFSYIKKAGKDLSELIGTINKAIDKFRDNIPLELGEALNEYLNRHPEFKKSKVTVKETGESKEISFSEIHEEINKGTIVGKDYQKAMYKLAFEDLRKKEKQL